MLSEESFSGSWITIINEPGLMQNSVIKDKTSSLKDVVLSKIFDKITALIKEKLACWHL